MSAVETLHVQSARLAISIESAFCLELGERIRESRAVSGKPALGRNTFAWLTHMGRQNCAVVEVKGSADSYTGPAPYRANTFSDGTCKNVEGVDDVFPNPGQQVFYGGKMSSSSPAVRTSLSWH